MDFRQFYRAAEVILHGETRIPTSGVADGVGWAVSLSAASGALQRLRSPLLSDRSGRRCSSWRCSWSSALAIPYVLGVRDWRCYGLVLAVAAGDLGDPDSQRHALVRSGSCAVPGAFAIAQFQPRSATRDHARREVLPLASRRVAGRDEEVRERRARLRHRRRASPRSWAVIGFAGIASYPELLRGSRRIVGDDSYTAYIVGLDLGLPSAVARVIWLALGLGTARGVVVLGRRGDDCRAFVVAIAASLALTPIVWLHYFALLARGGGRLAPAARGRLVRPACDGRDARERTSDAVRDSLDARYRSADDRARARGPETVAATRAAAMSA